MSSSNHQYNHQKYRPHMPVQLKDRTWPDQVIEAAPRWCSVDLRDGNQALIEPMTVAQKLKLFDLLVKVGFKEIEVGFPAASQTDFDFVRCLIEDGLIPDDVTVQVLTQAREDLISRSYESLKGAKRAIVHVYNSTSTVQREKVFGLDKDGIKAIAVKGAELVKRYAEAQPDTDWHFQYSPESFTGTEIDYAIEVCDAVTDVWQPTPERPIILNLPATVEMTTPNVYADQIEYFCRQIKNRQSVLVSLHTHNDRGCAVAAAELAVQGGADRVEGTLLGNGERTGNMDIVTMGMNLYSRGVDPQLDFSNIDEIIQVVKACTNLPVHPRHPYAGELVFTAFSGSHQDAIKKCLAVQSDDEPWDVAYLPIDPSDLGRSYQEVIRINSQSGKGGIAYVLEQVHGLQLPRWLQIDFSTVVQRHAENTESEVSPEVIWELFQQYYLNQQTPYSLEAFQISHSDNRDHLSATLKHENKEVSVSAEGAGVVESFVSGLSDLVGEELVLVDYSEHAVTSSANSEAACYVQMNINGQRFSGVGLSRDIVDASLQAILCAVNNYIRG
ncbi:2-isopropylmalate synthase, partial [Pseudomonadales bacterium]|nr:2-isopropylmalate synthase [Pseudomonadales bacterium]